MTSLLTIRNDSLRCGVRKLRWLALGARRHDARLPGTQRFAAKILATSGRQRPLAFFRLGRLCQTRRRSKRWPSRPSRPSRRKAPSASSSSRRPAAKSRPILPCALPSRAHERMRQPTMEHATRTDEVSIPCALGDMPARNLGFDETATQVGSSNDPSARLLRIIGRRGGWTLHELNHESGLSVPELQHTLLLLELDGRIRYSSGRVDRVAPRRGIGKGQGDRPAS